jgi:hypothetical protein
MAHNLDMGAIRKQGGQNAASRLEYWQELGKTIFVLDFGKQVGIQETDMADESENLSKS